MRKLFASMLAIAVICTSVFSYSYNAFGPLAGNGNFAVNPFIYADGTGFAGTDLFLQMGLTDNIDFITQMSVNNLDGTDFSVMARHKAGDNSALALRLAPSYVTPQAHTYHEGDVIGLQTNVVAQFSYDYMDKPAFWAVISPLVKFFDGKVDVFCEVNPVITTAEAGDFANLWVREKGFDLDVVPGIGLAIGDNTLVSFACPIYNLTGDATPTLGAWFWFAVPTAK